MAPLWILGLLSRFRLRLRLVTVSVSCSASPPCFSASSFPAQPGFPSASPFIPILAFLSALSISGVLAAQPALSFLLASVLSTVVLLSNLPILSPRLIPDFLGPSQLLPFFNLYGLILARLVLRFLGSCSVRRFRRLFLEPPSSVRRHGHPLRYSLGVVVLLIGVPFLCGLSFSGHRFLFRPVTLCFMFYVLCFMFYFGLDFYGVCMCWIMDLECLCLVLRLWQRCIVTRLGPRQSSRLSFFPTRRLRRLFLLSRFSLSSPSFLSVAFISESPPWPRPSSFNLGFFVRRSRRCWLSRGLSTVGGRYCHKCRVSPTRWYFSSHFRT